MIIEDFAFKLKDNRQALLRSPREDDAEEILEFMKTCLTETDFLLSSLKDFAKTVEDERNFLKKQIESKDIAMIVCYVDGKPVGSSAINFNTKIKTLHRSNIGITILSKFWGLGIGSTMMEKLILLAKERGGVLKIELDMIEGNVRARHLYEKYGFRITAVFPEAIYLNGKYLNEYMMTKDI